MYTEVQPIYRDEKVEIVVVEDDKSGVREYELRISEIKLKFKHPNIAVIMSRIPQEMRTEFIRSRIK